MVSMRDEIAPDRAAADRNRRSPWRRGLVALPVMAVAALLALAGGLVAFVVAIDRLAPPSGISADALVVLTGNHERIETGIALIQAGIAPRLLISGVDGEASANVVRGHPGGDSLFDCCIDFGLTARSTFDNAREARQWAQGKAIGSLVVVTSDFHLPRAMIHFTRAFPRTTLIPYPVESSPPVATWYRHRGFAILLVEEYLKYLFVRTGLNRLYENE